MTDQRVGGIEDVTMRAIVLLQLDQVLDPELTFELGHVADIGAAKGIDALIVIADGEHARGVFSADSGQ